MNGGKISSGFVKDRWLPISGHNRSYLLRGWEKWR